MQYCDGLINVRLTVGCCKCHFLLATIRLSWGFSPQLSVVGGWAEHEDCSA